MLNETKGKPQLGVSQDEALHHSEIELVVVILLHVVNEKDLEGHYNILPESRKSFVEKFIFAMLTAQNKKQGEQGQVHLIKNLCNLNPGII